MFSNSLRKWFRFVIELKLVYVRLFHFWLGAADLPGCQYLLKLLSHFIFFCLLQRFCMEVLCPRWRCPTCPVIHLLCVLLLEHCRDPLICCSNITIGFVFMSYGLDGLRTFNDALHFAVLVVFSSPQITVRL